MSLNKKRPLPFYYLTVGAAAAYVAFFLILYPTLGESVVIFSFVPPLVVAWIGGARRGAAAAVISNAVTLELLYIKGLPSWDATSLLHRSPGVVSVIVIAVIVGYLRDLRERMKKELEHGKNIEKALKESEERFKSIYEGSNDALMLLDENGFFDCNARTLELFGFRSKEDFTRVHPADISPPNQPDGRQSFPAAQERIAEAYRLGSNRFEWVHRRSDGQDFPAEVLLSAFDFNGKRVLQATVRDITKRKRAETALADSEKSFRSMFELTSDGVAILHPQNLRFIAANPAMCALFGYTEEEFLTLTPEDITPPDAKEIMRGAMSILSKGENVPDHEGISIKKDGTSINAIVCCRQLLWKGEPVFYITFKDVTFLKDIQQRLENKNREILDLTNSITHDLKKPLTVMKTISSLLSNESFGKLNADGKEAVSMSSEAIENMQEMLNDLLAIAKLESSGYKLTLEQFDLHAVVLEEVKRLKFTLEEKKIAVTVDEPLGSVLADKKGVSHIYMNLLGNAVNYIGVGPHKKIEAGMTAVAGKNVYFVRDSGIGIPDDTKKTLFQKFNRGSNVSGISGTGLGLSIVKGIVEAHGGTIWVESKLGEGTAFYFTLAGG